MGNKVTFFYFIYLFTLFFRLTQETGIGFWHEMVKSSLLSIPENSFRGIKWNCLEIRHLDITWSM